MPRVSAILDAVDHRPWPAPRRPWSIFMRWHDLAFLHWPVAAECLRERLPEGLRLDMFAGTAWLGIVPFRMSGIRHRAAPPFPGTTAFAELNVRTYVEAGGKSGVWFFSLDAASRLAVRAARTWFHLPYFDARMHVAEKDGAIEYRSERAGRAAEPRCFAATYRAAGAPFTARAGSLEHWLTERYCLYAAAGKKLYRGEICHRPWPLQAAEAIIAENSMAGDLLDSSPTECPVVHFARELEVVAWSLRPL